MYSVQVDEFCLVLERVPSHFVQGDTHVGFIFITDIIGQSHMVIGNHKNVTLIVIVLCDLKHHFNE